MEKLKSLNEFDSLTAAKEYTYSKGKLIHRNTMNFILAQNNCYTKLKDISKNILHPMQDLVAAFLDSTEYNLIQTSVTGQGVINLIQKLIDYESGDFKTNLSVVLATSIAVANPEYHPYEGVSEYDWRVARNEDIAKLRVVPNKGYVDVKLTISTEEHNPRVYVKVADNDYRYVTSLRNLSTPSIYSCQVPSNYSEFYVDNFYEGLEEWPIT